MAPHARSIFLGLMIPFCGWCQPSSPELSARILYYREQPDQDNLPTVSKAKAAGNQTKSVDNLAEIGKAPGSGKTNASSATRSERRDAAKKGPTVAEADPPFILAVHNLGLRYNVILFSDDKRNSNAVDTERMFHPHDCITFEVQSNRSGYLYVLEQGSSRQWKSLFPSAEMPDEGNIIHSRISVRAPMKYCFEIEGPPGVERVFVVVSRNANDLYNLHQALQKGESANPPKPATRSEQSPVLLTKQNTIDQEVTRMRADLQSRDLKSVRVPQPEDPTEAPNSVYVVRASTDPQDRVVAEILINHQ